MYYSIIVPIYKVEKYLPQCIESILTQTYQNFELILVDDGSPDTCSDICEKYAKKDSRIQVVHKENGGLVSARKAGLTVSSGEYVCFVDGDDFVSADMLETYEREIYKHRVDVICAGYSLYYDEQQIVKVLQSDSDRTFGKKELQSEVYTKMLSQRPFFSFFIFPSLCTKCMRRDIVKKIYEGVPEKITLGEDVAVTYPIMLKADSISILTYCGYMYRQLQTSMTHSYDSKLHEKINNLITYLKLVAKQTEWQSESQINEYALFLLILEKDNEFKYNLTDSYHKKKKNMKKSLIDPVFKEALEKVHVYGVRNKIVLFCFRRRFFMPIYLHECILRLKRKRREK